MVYKESEFVELKRQLDDSMKAEIIAFLNSYLGGTIYVGVEDDGTLSKSTEHEEDLNESKVINWIRDEAIYPNCSQFVKVFFNKDGLLEIQIEPGNEKPYYLKSNGLKPSGVYIRYGRNKSQATQEEITRMISERNRISYELYPSFIQELTFDTLKEKYRKLGLDFEAFKPSTSGFIFNHHFTNLAYWFSDQYHVETKMAVYQGLDRGIFRTKKQYEGSIISQLDNALDYFDLCNEIRIIINGKPMRTEIPSYSDKAAREIILNCYCHHDYDRKSNIKIEFFDDRCEFLSPGGFFGGLTLEKAIIGEQSFRNEYVVKLLYKLGYIENYASGISRINQAYNDAKIKPQFLTSSTGFKVTLANANYEALYLHPEQHIKDNESVRNIHNLTDTVNIENDVANSKSVTPKCKNDTLKIENDIVKKLKKRDLNIYKTIKLYPGLRFPQLYKYLKIEDASLTRVTFSRRIAKLNDLIEFVGASKTGGYYIK